ncbi:MAG TPA: hypothetical protein VK589_04650 [Chryseolinea sp.]|nr:hypothetical protein [Chryseolinea sp.]
MRLERTPITKNLRSIDPQFTKSGERRTELIGCLLSNNITKKDLIELREGDPSVEQDERKGITAEELSVIIQRIYDLNEKYIFDLSAVDGMLRRFNLIKNNNRNYEFAKKIRRGFRDLKDTEKKVILAEGDSWFNYPIILTDIIDRIRMEKNFALYSLAAGGDWFLNMLTGREYVEELSLLHPDIFLISGGGNDLVGSKRLAAIVDPSGESKEYQKNEWAKEIIGKANEVHTKLDATEFEEGCKYLSKDFFALLMFFHLQYYFLIDGILGKKNEPGKFSGMKIITQGYDYARPSHAKGIGFNPINWYIPFIRFFLGHGGWLKEPLQMRGIPDDNELHRKIIYAMIYLFNEMMIDIGRLFREERSHSNIFHIDSRGLVGPEGWVDELHVKPKHAMKIGDVFIKCINESAAPTYPNVYVVKKF